MRTNLTIDDDVLAAAKGLAAREGRNIGAVISDLSRQALQKSRVETGADVRNGVPLLSLSAGALPVTMEVVSSIRDELV